MEGGKRILIVGGVAAGPKAASRIARLMPEASVTVIERNEVISYAGCGLPYYVSGAVPERSDLITTGSGYPRDAEYFRSVKNVEVRTGTQAVAIDRKGKRLRVRKCKTGETMELPYDHLVLCTGASPLRPAIPGLELKGISVLHGMEDAHALRTAVSHGGVKSAVVIGGGYIGIETAEALAERGVKVTIIEMLSQILYVLDYEMAKIVEGHLKEAGVDLRLNTTVLAFEGDERVRAVVTDKGERIPTDLVVLSVGVRPNVNLAKEAGLEIGETGAIRVDFQMRTSDPQILAAGDCVETRDLVSGKPVFIPLGSTANKQARVAANTICGIADRFDGVVGSSVLRVFDFSVARTGLTESRAHTLQIQTESVLVPGPDRAHYMPGAEMLYLKLVADRRTRRILGVQALGRGEAAKRVDVAATAVTGRMTVDDAANLDLSYAPPFASAMDNLITAANVARNKLDGLFRGVSPAELWKEMRGGEPLILVDVRTEAEFKAARLPLATLIPLPELRRRSGELPKGESIVLYCRTSLRAYEAARILSAAGFARVRVLDGGAAMWPFEMQT